MAQCQQIPTKHYRIQMGSKIRFLNQIYHFAHKNCFRLEHGFILFLSIFFFAMKEWLA